MKKAVKKISTVKKAKKAKKAPKAKPASTANAEGQINNGVVNKQPQDKEQAAVARAMFLFVDDVWAQRYFDPNDLHFLEREVFG